MPEYDPARRHLSRRITFVFLGLGGIWVVTAWMIVPAVIQSAYAGGAFGALSGLMPGRDLHPVEFYLRAWSTRAWQVLAVLVAAWFVVIVASQPTARRLVRALYRRTPTLGGRLDRATVLTGVAVIVVTFAQAIHLADRRRSAQGHEYLWVAQSVAEGHGFEFPPGRRWLFVDHEPADDVYGATAWKEPVYPYFIAAWFSLLGERRGRFAVLLVQATCVAATTVIVYHLGSLLYRPALGAAAALLVVSIPALHRLAAGTLEVSSVSGLLLVSVLFMLFRYRTSPTHRKVVLVGIILGFSALTHVLLILLVPIAVLFVLLHTPGNTWRESAPSSLLIVLAAAVVIAPWTIRNYLEFGHLIPVQTGFGQLANVSNAYLAETYRPGFDACGDGSPPAYRATGPATAVRMLSRDRDLRSAAYERAIACVAERAGPGYFELNEHERDGLHRAQFVRFALERPRVFLELTATKAIGYLFSGMLGRISIVTTMLGIIGLVLALRRPGMWILPAIVFAFTGTYSLTSPLFARYRAPLEPILTLMAVAATTAILYPAWRRLKRAVEPPKHRAID